jgi:hypothetical protein
VQQTLLFRVLLHALFAAALARALRGVPPGRALLFAALYLLSCSLGPDQEEYRLLLVLALLIAPDLQAPRRVPWAPALAGALAAFYLLIKVSVGLSAIALLGSFGLLLLPRRRPWSRRSAVAAGAGFAVAAAAAVPFVFGSPGYALRWLGLEAELVRGFSSGMRLPGEPADLAAGVLALAVFAGLCLYAWRTGAAAAGVWTMFLLPAWLVFQHGFIRADAHSAVFFPFLLAAVAFGLLFAQGEPELHAGAAASLALLVLGVPVAMSFEGSGGAGLVLGVQGWENVSWALSPDRLQHRIKRAQRRVLQPSRLPRDFVAPIRRADLGVDVLPWELSYLAANDLRWVPNPTFQLYTTYTRRLDAVAARHFVSSGAPDILLVHEGTLDGRDMLWDTPETWRAVLAGYQLDPGRPAPDLLALRRRPQPLAWRLAEKGRARIEPGPWIDVPAAAGEWTFAALDFEPSWSGRVRRLILGVPPVYLQVLDDRGGNRRVRILPETAGGGLLLAPLPKNLDELAALWSGGGSVGRIVRFRLTGPGVSYFGTPVRVRWLAGRASG